MSQGGAYRVAKPGDKPELIQQTQNRKAGEPMPPAKPAAPAAPKGGKSK